MKKFLFILLLVTGNRTFAQSCQAGFIFSQGSGGAVSFTTTSTGTTGNTYYFWDWDDQTAQAGAGPYTHTFYYNGTYHVRHSILDSTTGCSNLVMDTVVVTTAAPCNIHASVTHTIGSGGIVTFSNTSTGCGGNSWFNFHCGNGSTTAGTASGWGGTTTNFPYNGLYVATLTITGGGCSSTYSDTVIITGQLNCNLSSSYTDTLGANGLASFYNTSTGVLSNMKAIWNFGDGTLADTGDFVNHNYAFNGTYHVTLFEKDSFNMCKDSVGINITITNAPNTCTSTPTFSLSQDTSQAHSWFAVPNYSSQVINAVWSWGDGSTTSGLYPSHTYTAAGTYSICVKVYFACGDSATYCQSDSLSKNAAGQMIYISVVNGLAGIAQTAISPQFINIYPNPGKDHFTIESGKGAGELKIFDISGKEVFTTKVTGKDLIDLGFLENGIYTLLIKGDLSAGYKKLIIAK